MGIMESRDRGRCRLKVESEEGNFRGGVLEKVGEVFFKFGFCAFVFSG